MSGKHQFTPRVRKLPFKMEECLSYYPNQEALIRDISNLPGGMATALTKLAASLFIEFGESQLTFLDKHFGTEILMSEDNSNFVKQEWVHSSYHHILNSFFEPRYMHILDGKLKLNYLSYPYLASRELLLNEMIKPTSPQAKENAFKQLIFANSAFEVTVGLLDAFASFEVFIANTNLFMEHSPFWTYLWMYHSTEEMEHIHIPLRRFEEKYKESLCSKENLAVINSWVDAFHNSINCLALQLSINGNYNLKFADLYNNPERVKSIENRKIVQVGFDIEMVADKRREYIDLWDKKYEPMMRKAVESWMAKKVRAAA